MISQYFCIIGINKTILKREENENFIHLFLYSCYQPSWLC